ncbi:glycosyltransferase 87 family protein [Yinghuangia sp. YIM S09857]|uniref:glycosyltransferase 87 family protein n=1 Tax=Yinghuangia sp. YIM S09857 TaxID=3436929 RepID=UPI003F53AEBC
MESPKDMSFHRVLVSSCRELLTLAPRTPYGTTRDKAFGRGRLLLLVGVPAALLTLGLWAWWSLTQTDIFWKMFDLSVYHNAAAEVDDRGQYILYERPFGIWQLPFIYPPFSAYIFVKLLPLGFAGLKWFMTISSFVSILAVCWASWGMLGYRRSWGRLGAALVTFAAVVWLEPVSWTLIWGQVNLALLAIVLLDLAQPDSRWWKGIGVGLAAGFKLTPAIFIVYLVMTRRFKAAAAAVAAFFASVLFGWIVLPDASQTYWTNLSEISGRVDSELSVGTLNNQSVKGMLTRLIDNESVVGVVWLVLCAAVVILGLLAAAKASLAGRELLGVVIVGTLSLLVSPISWSHHWVWVIPAFVLLAHKAFTSRRKLWWFATAGFFVFYASWPMQINALGKWDDRIPLQPFGLMWLVPRDDDRESHWNVWQFFVGNSYLLAGIVLTVVVSCLLLRNTSLTPAEPVAEGTPGSDGAAQTPEPVGAPAGAGAAAVGSAPSEPDPTDEGAGRKGVGIGN